VLIHPQTQPSAAWRVVVGVSLIPAFGTLYQRLTLPESTRFIASQDKSQDVMELKKKQGLAESDHSTEEPKNKSGEVEVAEVLKKKAHFKGMHFLISCSADTNTGSQLVYFSEWRHGKMLIGTCMCWFLLDIACVPTSHPYDSPYSWFL
jgi:PHS family inorganic phosphate transporter-like MFS transporter